MTEKCTIISNEQGSSLIVVGLFVMALGMMSAAGLQLYSQYGQAQRTTETQANLEIVKTAMLAYFSKNGRFPCPAPMNEVMDSDKYGLEAESPCGNGGPGAGDPPPATPPEAEVVEGTGGGTGGGGITIDLDTGGAGLGIGDTEIDLGNGGTGGLGIELGGAGGLVEIALGGGADPTVPTTTAPVITPPTGTPPITTQPTDPLTPLDELPANWKGKEIGWDLPADGTYSPSTTKYKKGTIIVRGRDDKNVRIGNIPTRALNLPDSMGFDQWGNRLVYVVTEDLALTGAQDINNLGAITIQDPNGNSVTSSPGNAVLLIMSTGGDPRGAMTPDGKIIESCDVSSIAGKNCDANAVFINSLNKNADNGNDTFSTRMVFIGADFKAE